MGVKSSSFCSQVCVTSNNDSSATRDLSSAANPEVSGAIHLAKAVRERADDETKFETVIKDNDMLVVNESELNDKITSGIKNRQNSMGTFKFSRNVGDSAKIIEKSCVFLKNENVYYKGEWNMDNQFHGIGTLLLLGKGLYCGSFKQGRFSGFGRFINEFGDYYEGCFKEGKSHGTGVFEIKNEIFYQGEWANDKQHGKGTEIRGDGEKYEGDFKNGQKEGNGVIFFEDGSIYKGALSKGQMEGEGVYRWSDGRSYEGAFKKGKMHGQGVFTWPNGNKFEGRYAFNKKAGKGKFIEGDDFWIEGTWKTGFLEGNVILNKDGKQSSLLFRRGHMILGSLVDEAKPEGVQQIENDLENCVEGDVK